MHRLSEDLEYLKTARFFIPTDWTILNNHRLEGLDYPCTDWEILNIPTDCPKFLNTRRLEDLVYLETERS